MTQTNDHKYAAPSAPLPDTNEASSVSKPPPTWEGQLVFVYGTLKRGETNHHWLERASWQGEAELPGVVLHDLGPFPMAVIGQGMTLGQVYAVDQPGLARLDELEGYLRLYDRQVLSMRDGRRAWVYLGRPRQVRYAPLVVVGMWRTGEARCGVFRQLEAMRLEKINKICVFSINRRIFGLGQTTLWVS
jgi:gamma-glutamylcyclotransferase (GGCT)/AIG2-like uncharacterized protein YtfP